MHGAFKASARSPFPFAATLVRRSFDPFNWHNLAFDPFNLSPRAGQCALRNPPAKASVEPTPNGEPSGM